LVDNSSSRQYNTSILNLKEHMMKASAFVILTGLLLTFGAVGGIEHNEAVLTAVIVAVVGLLTLGAGVLMMRRHRMDEEEYSPYNTNNS